MKRSTLAALAVLAALGAYIYWFERGPASESDAERVFDVEEDAIVRVELQDRDRAPVVAEKTDERWRLVAPVDADADATAMNELAQNLATLGYRRAVAKASEVDLAAFGLDAPSVRVRFETKDGEKLGLDFGSDTPTPGNQYARRAEGEDVLVLASYLSLNFQKTAWDLRDKAIFHVAEDAEPTRLEIARRGEAEIVLARENGRWRVETPLRARADGLEVEGLARRVRGAEMEEVLSESEDVPDTVLAAPRVEIRLELDGDAPPLVLRIGDERELGDVARTPSRPETFLVSRDLVADLERVPTDFVSRKLFEGPTFDVKRLRLDGRALEKRAAGPEESWHETAPESGEIPAGAVDDLLFELSATRAENILLEAPELGAPAHRLALVSGEPEREDVLEIWTPAGERVYARREGDEVVLELTAESWAKVASRLALAPEGSSSDEP